MPTLTAAAVVNDVHSRLNRTVVSQVHYPRDINELQAIVRHAADLHQSIATCGARHAMGGQQFAADQILIDTTKLCAPIHLDNERGLLEIEAGANWTQVIDATQTLSQGRWAIRQKQTGADTLTLGGAVSANAHGRGLLMAPIVDDIESLTLVNSGAELITCSRTQNRELFTLAVGGYGLFGVIATVTLRLAPRRKLQRVVDILDIDEAIPAVRRRVADGCQYGDFQYAIDPADDAFLRRGICCCYQPVADDAQVSDACSDLHESDWIDLLSLAHTDKRRAFQRYAAHYLSSHGRVYWSDEMQLGTYVPTWQDFLAATAHAGAERVSESLVIGELYVPPDALQDFLTAARRVLRERGVEDIYGSIRSIQPDTTTFLPWARQHYACVIFNLRTRHTPDGIAQTEAAFRALIAAALAREGSFYLTYHRFATRAQIEAAYPQFEEFLAHKRRHDPNERFTSDWYRHMSATFLRAARKC